MNTHFAPLRVPRPRHFVEDDQPSRSPDVAVARYVDREIRSACATAELCIAVAVRARSQGRHLVADVLREFQAGLTDEAALLAPAALPDVQWPPRRATWQVESDADVDAWIRTVGDALRHSEQILRWIARRPDLPALARVTFDALASSRHAQRRLLLACSAIDDRCLAGA